MCLTSYNTHRGNTDLLNSTKIWEACQATSAASSFFDPIAIGRYGEEFVDGATGVNNPVCGKRGIKRRPHTVLSHGKTIETVCCRTIASMCHKAWKRLDGKSRRRRRVRRPHSGYVTSSSRSRPRRKQSRETPPNTDACLLYGHRNDPGYMKARTPVRFTRKPRPTQAPYVSESNLCLSPG